MQQNLLTFLKTLANKDDLKNNQLAWLIPSHFDRLNLNSKDKFYESIIPHYKLDSDWISPTIDIQKDQETIELESFYSKDFRLKKILLKNFRGFPQKEDFYPFGVSFTQDGKPQNMIIIGSNGIGKSSIYEAIEYSYCQRIGEAELRTFDDDIEDDSEYFMNYISNLNVDFNEVFCKTETIEGTFDIHGSKMFSRSIKSKLNPNTHFISDFDIYYLGHLSYSDSGERTFHNLIANSLGLNDYLSFNKLINQLKGYKRLKESKELNSKRESRGKSNKDLEAWNTEIAKRKIQLTEIDKDIENQNISIDYSKYQQVLSSVKQRDFLSKFSNIKIVEAAREYFELFNALKALNINTFNHKEAEFLAIGFDLLENSKDCPFCNNSKLDLLELRANIQIRITAIQEFVILRDKLKQSHDYLLSLFSSWRNELIRTRDLIFKESEEIKLIPDFSSMSILNQDFSNQLADNLNLDFFVKFQDYFQIASTTEQGFTNLYNLIKEYKEYIKSGIPTYIELLNGFIKKRGEIIQQVESSISSKSNLRSSYDIKIILNKEIADFELKIKSTTQNILVISKEIEQTETQYAIYESIKKDSESYIRIVNSEINNIVNDAFDPIQDTIIQILNDYLKEDEIELKIEKVIDDYDSESGEILSQFITARIKHKTEKIDLSPNKYFNTFRFRLFSMIVGISVAIASRIKTKINMPLVLDDVFYASDYERRTTIEMFIKNLFVLFEKYTPTVPLQLILFTHDELIFDSAYNAIGELNKIDETIFSRLLSHYESIKVNDYWELCYRMPNKLPSFLLEELNIKNQTI
jgi:hypothetical protein